MAHTPDELKAVMEKEGLAWRSFAGDGSIAQSWNSPPTPTFYVLDGAGVIRHKWIGHPGEKSMEAAVDRLVDAALDRQ